MTPQNLNTHEVVTFDDLKPLAAANGPCITAIIMLQTPAEIDVRLKNAVRGIREKAKHAIQPATLEDLLAPIYDLAAAVHANRLWAHALILFRSPSIFRYYLLHGHFEEVQEAGDRFQIRPLLQTLAHETRFYMLALSRKRTRLLDCTQHQAKPIDTDAFPTNLELWLNNRQPDHVRANRSTAGPSVGKMKGVVSGSNADRDRENQYQAHFFKEVDRGVNTFLGSQPAPLVLAGVEEEMALYRRVNTYRPILDEGVRGSPDGVPDRTLHDRAMEVVAHDFVEPLRKAIAEVRESANTPRGSSDPDTVIQASFQGRVMDLLIDAESERWGSFDPETQTVDTGNRREELLNAAALEALRQGGQAFVLNHADMPVQSAAAAVFRF